MVFDITPDNQLAYGHHNGAYKGHHWIMSEPAGYQFAKFSCKYSPLKPIGFVNNTQRQKENDRLKCNYRDEGAWDAISYGKYNREYQADNTSQDIRNDIFFVFLKTIYDGNQ